MITTGKQGDTSSSLWIMFPSLVLQLSLSFSSPTQNQPSSTSCQPEWARLCFNITHRVSVAVATTGILESITWCDWQSWQPVSHYMARRILGLKSTLCTILAAVAAKFDMAPPSENMAVFMIIRTLMRSYHYNTNRPVRSRQPRPVSAIRFRWRWRDVGEATRYFLYN